MHAHTAYMYPGLEIWICYVSMCLGQGLYGELFWVVLLIGPLVVNIIYFYVFAPVCMYLWIYHRVLFHDMVRCTDGGDIEPR